MLIKRHHIFIFLYILSLSYSEGIAQSQFIDSLKQVVATQPKDSFYVKNLIELGIQTRGIDLDVSKDYFDQALAAAELVKFNRGQGLAYYHRAVIEYFLADFVKSDSFLMEALAIAQSTKNIALQSGIENVRGVVLQKLGKTAEAIDAYYNSASHFLEMGDSVNYAAAIGNIAEVHLQYKNYQEAERLYIESSQILERSGEPEQYGSTYIGLSSSSQSSDRKRYFASKALALGLEYSIPQFTAYAYNKLGEIYLDIADSLDRAEYFLLEGLEVCRSYQENYITSSTLMNLGNVYLKKGNDVKAAGHLEEALAMSKAAGFIEISYYSSKYLATLRKRQGKLEMAYDHLSESQVFSDSLFNENFTNQIHYSSALFESEKKEAEIARQQLLLARQNARQRMLTYGGLAVIFMVSALFFGLYQRSKRKRRETELALQLEHRRAEDLVAMSKVKTDFFNNVSHELRTPLTLVIAPIEDALPNIRNVDVRDQLLMALKNSKKLLNLTNEIMDLSKADAAKLSVVESNVELVGFLRRVYHSFDSLARSRNITLKEEILLPVDLSIRTDVQKLESILTNLISNAIKYSPDGQEVGLIVNALDKAMTPLHIQIVDRGNGIPENELPYIFGNYTPTILSTIISGI